MSEPAPLPHTISIEFFSKSTNKTTQLVNNDSAEFVMEGQHRWYDYSFIRPVYLTNLFIECEGYGRFDDFELEVDHIDGTQHKQEIRVSENKVELSTGKLASGFRFRPASKWRSNTLIIRVVASGFSLSEFHAFEWAIKEHEKKSIELNSREKSVLALEETVEELTSKKSSLDSEIGKSQAQQSELQTSIDSLQTRNDELSAKGEDLRAQIKSHESQLRKLSSRVSETSDELDTLTRELRLYPSEIAEFVREGGRNIQNYLLISVPFVLVLIAVTFSLYSRAIDLTQIWRTEEGVDVWTIFLTRLPFVLIAITLIEATGYIIGRLIFEIIRINRIRLELSKLSIVAKDVSVASATNTDLNDDELFEHETKLKMELLREHLKGYSGNEFEYKGSAIISAIVGVANRLSRSNQTDS